MSIERVKEYFKKEFGREDLVVETEESSATVAEAAKAIGTEECRIAKTLAFAFKEQVILLVVAGDARVDNKKFKETFGIKAKMLAFDRTEELTGFAPGGVCPFGAKAGVKIYLDDSLQRFPSVFPAAGSDHSHVEMTMTELEHFIPYAGWVDVTKLPV